MKMSVCIYFSIFQGVAFCFNLIFFPPKQQSYNFLFYFLHSWNNLSSFCWQKYCRAISFPECRWKQCLGGLRALCCGEGTLCSIQEQSKAPLKQSTVPGLWQVWVDCQLLPIEMLLVLVLASREQISWSAEYITQQGCRQKKGKPRGVLFALTSSVKAEPRLLWHHQCGPRNAFSLGPQLSAGEGHEVWQSPLDFIQVDPCSVSASPQAYVAHWVNCYLSGWPSATGNFNIWND